MRFALSVLAALSLAPVAVAQDAAPRRLLFIHVSDYLYLNPLTHAAPGGPDRTRDAATRLADGLRVPTAKDNDQLFVLSDTDSPTAPLPTKDALAKALAAFCDTTRAQDRVVIYIGAHAAEKDGKALVVPIDGDPDAPASLLPVADVYARLRTLKASQIVVIWDVCRHNADRVRGRREIGAMTPALFRALTAAPEGVEVLVSCSADEHAIEYFTPHGPAGVFAGSAYLDALRQAAEDHRAGNPKEPAGAAVPVKALHTNAAQAVGAVAKATGTKQTPALHGGAPKDPTAFDPKEKPAKRFELPSPDDPRAEDAKAVLAELWLPPVLSEDTGGPLARLAFTEAALKGYATDVSVEDALKDLEKYPVRVATLRALQTVRDVWPLGGKEQRAVGVLNSPVTDPAKKAVTDAQEPVAKALVRLELELMNLEAVSDKRARETKRWQAHYNFALSELRFRVVALSQYSRALGKVRTETLPDLDGGSGWRLVPSAQIDGPRDTRELYKLADDGFAQLVADHKGTPWEVLAKRSRAGLPGAKWVAIPK